MKSFAENIPKNKNGREYIYLFMFSTGSMMLRKFAILE